MILAVLLLPTQSVSAGTFTGQNGRITFTKPSGGIWTVRPNGTWAQRLSVRMATEMAWSPDGMQPAFVEPGVGGTTRLQVMNSKTGKTRSLTHQTDISDSEPAWSPSGKKLLFNDSEGQIYTIWADGTRRAVISDGDSYGASWSPDGSRIAFLEDFSGESISVSEPDGTILYIPLALSRYNRVDAPVWSPDGQRLAFVATNASTGKRDLLSITLANTARPYEIANDVGDNVAWQSIVK